MCRKRFLSVLLSFCLFGASFPYSLFSEEAETLTIYLPRLYAIVIRYELQTEILKNELQTSQINLTELGKRLTIYEENETTYKKNATEYEARITSLSQESESLRKAQADLTKSIETSGQSWTKYADRAETKIKRLERWNKALTWIAGGLAAAAIAAGTAWAVK